MVSIQFIVCLYNSLEHRPSTQIFLQLLSDFCHVCEKICVEGLGSRLLIQCVSGFIYYWPNQTLVNSLE